MRLLFSDLVFFLKIINYSNFRLELISLKMQENKNSKILLALLAGAAIGAAIGYFLNSDKKDEVIDNLKKGASDLKDDLAEEIEKGKNFLKYLKLWANNPLFLKI